MKNCIILTAAVILVGSQTLADTYECTFSSRSLAIPSDVIVSTSSETDRVGINDSLRRSIGYEKNFGDISRETSKLLRVKWKFKQVPVAIMLRVGDARQKNIIFYTLDIKKSNGSAKLLAITQGTGTQPIEYRDRGSCKKTG